ncbi:ATP-binding cassette domain-containing protein [Ferroacidibacillus organovorans]|uniref:ABC transporter domain-containing protein n=1 Tax=Ferroacidibacillus organovorans TaxID=1765683 RepID=A0A1V4EQH1_9BACL|nr:ATP-binding cassette domain-containing protein [Ferroacidibacillus organovorans]OPG15183.1 hypothetical protein B2M26_13625 [Ferroacidibacillus organovorans]
MQTDRALPLHALAEEEGVTDLDRGMSMGGIIEECPDVLVSLDCVTVQYEGADRPALNDVSLTIKKGEAVLLLGPSGCGKSTVARLLSGLIPRAMEASVQGRVTRAPELARMGAIGYVFQDPDAQFCMIEQDDEIAFGLENQRISQADMLARIQEQLQRMGLPDLPHVKHDRYSGGMKQKLALASALAMQPEWLICDEPTANLDPQATGMVFDELMRVRERGQSLLLIEHKFDRILPAMDRVILFDQVGRILHQGTPGEMMENWWEEMLRIGVIAPWKARPFQCNEVRLGQKVVLEEPKMAELKSQGDAFALKNVEVTYRKTPVLRVDSLHIKAGSFTAIVGPNGAGKTTLLQAMAGLISHRGGHLARFGAHSHKAEHDARLAYSFQNPEYQFVYSRVVDELGNRVQADETDPKLHELLTRFGLDGYEDANPFELSQGQKRRLSVASMLREPRAAYLLDEPTFGQDAKTQQVLLEQLETLHRDGRTIVLTTHDMDLVRQYATQVVVVIAGEVVASCAPERLFADEELMKRAHLLDDQADSRLLLEVWNGRSRGERADWATAKNTVATPWVERPRSAPARSLNPTMQLVMVLTVMIIGVFANNLHQAIALFLLPVALMLLVARLTPWQILKRLSPFLGFYLLYVWTPTAYGPVAPHEPTIHFLWMHPTVAGFKNGLVLAFRMLSAVCFGVLFVSEVDVTDLIISLCQNVRVSPRFAYGTLAGIRVIPLFQTEWVKLRQARALRGKEGRIAVLRPIHYALPLLTQAIRMSERVAIAMEARGFYGEVAMKATARSYYRIIPFRARDVLYPLAIALLAVSLIVIFQ